MWNRDSRISVGSTEAEWRIFTLVPNMCRIVDLKKGSPQIESSVQSTQLLLL